MRLRLPRRGSYMGRLAFDPETGYHVDPSGRRVVTDDAGRSWRYARRGDGSHIARYHTGSFLTVESTPAVWTRVALAAVQEHGVEKAKQIADETVAAQFPHHVEVQPHDPHHGGVRSDPDDVAATVTSHTDAWKEQA